MKNVVIYPRGFAGYDVGHPIIRAENELSHQIATSRFSKINSRETNSLVAQNVEEIYRALGNNEIVTETPELIEEAFTIFINAFGTHNFFEWCTVQKQNPYLTDLHVLFIKDTMRFLETGKRAYTLGTWPKLLTHGQSKSVAPDFVYEDFFLREPGFVNVKSLAHHWLAKPGGLSDMVGTLHIIFGK